MFFKNNALLVMALLLGNCGSRESEMTRSLKLSKFIDLTATHVFIVPHPDDWQLFMGEYAYDVIKSTSTRTVIIHSNAGDSGKSASYWKAREQASLASVRAVLGFSLSGDTSETHESLVVDTVSIEHHQLKNVSVYFLRLPDGDIEGDGFIQGNFQSLLKLQNNKITHITSLDGLNTYSHSELRSAIQNIIKHEHPNSSAEIRFYLQDPSSEKKFSHSDHLATQKFARDAIEGLHLPLCRTLAFVDYEIKNKSANLSTDEYAKKVHLFSAYDVVMLNLEAECNLCKSAHFDWLSRSYVREFDCE